MKKIIHGLLSTALLVSNAFGVVSNKTFIADVGSLSNNAVMGMTAAACGKKTSFGADVSVAGYYRQSHNEKDLAKYFGDGLTDATRLGTITFGDDEVVYHTTSGTVTPNPRRVEFGGHIQYNQCLSKVMKGLSFSVNVPVVRVETDMRTAYSDTTVKSFFEGTKPTVTEPTQLALGFQKHSATKLTATGVANIDVAVNYQFAKEADYSVGGSVVLEVPTGKKPAAVWAFEPLYGSKHFALGAGLNADFNLWKSETGNSSFDFSAGVNYKYGFKAKEVRTMGLYNNTNAAEENHGHYRSSANNVDDVATTSIANLTTKEMNVTPQSSVSALAGFKYSTGAFCVNACYNLGWNQEEKVEAPVWAATTYGIAETAQADGQVNLVGGDIKAANSATGIRISTTACTTPSRVTHKVGGGVDYRFNTATPIRVGAFGEGEWNANNASINSWAVGGKVGFCF